MDTFSIEIPSAVYGGGRMECKTGYFKGFQETMDVTWRIEKLGADGGLSGLITLKSDNGHMLTADDRCMTDFKVELSHQPEHVPYGSGYAAKYAADIVSRKYTVDTRADNRRTDTIEIAFTIASAPALVPSWTDKAEMAELNPSNGRIELHTKGMTDHGCFKPAVLYTVWTRPDIVFPMFPKRFEHPEFKFFKTGEGGAAAMCVSTDNLVIKARNGYMVIDCYTVVTDIDTNFRKGSPMHALRDEKAVEAAKETGGGIWDASAFYDIATLVAFAWRYLVFETPSVDIFNFNKNLMVQTEKLARLLGYDPPTGSDCDA